MPISDEFDQALDDLTGRLEQDEIAAASAGAGELTPEARMGLRLEPGAAVRDLKTGEIGNVIAGTIRHVLIQRP